MGAGAGRSIPICSWYARKLENSWNTSVSLVINYTAAYAMTKIPSNSVIRAIF